MPTCPTCSSLFEPPMQFCPRDGTALVAAQRNDPLVGRVIGERYRLEARLGRGAMGTVYRALHTRMDKPVAIKLLRAELAGDADSVARFHREARSASRLDHEHCIRVTDFGQTDDGLLYLAMELLDGVSLAGIAARGPMPPGEVAAVAHDISLALQHAHEHDVIHRDLKPDNVMLCRRGARSTFRPVVKVLDFGLAKIAGEVAGPTLTRAGSVFGTPEFMAPEQAQGLPQDSRSDLYSLGVMMYQLIVGELPFRAPTYLALLAKQVEEPPVPPRARRPDLSIPPALEELILHCLEKTPDARPASAEAISAALAPFAQHGPLAVYLRISAMAEAPAAKPEQQKPEPSVDSSAKKPVTQEGSTKTEPRSAVTEPIEAVVPSPTERETVPTVPTVSDERSLDAPESDDERAFENAEPTEAVVNASEPDPGPRSRRPTVFAIAAVALAAIGLTAWIARPVDKPSPPAPPAVVVDPLETARKLLDRGDLDGAGHILGAERAKQDGMRVQLLLGELEHKRGNRLGALAHLHRATRLSPGEAEPHARLAELLQSGGQPQLACKEVRAALAIDAKNAIALAAAAGCPR